MSHAKRIEEFNHDLLKFPPLMWVRINNTLNGRVLFYSSC